LRAFLALDKQRYGDGREPDTGGGGVPASEYDATTNVRLDDVSW
jgi:hypothetical protein